MTKLENSVTSLKLSKKMKDLNVKQDSAYQWTPKKDSDDYYVHRSETHFTWPYEFAAYTAQDLLDMFPKEFHLKRTGNFWKFSFNFPGKNGCIDLSIADDSNFANVLASMLITLIKDRNSTGSFGLLT